MRMTMVLSVLVLAVVAGVTAADARPMRPARSVTCCLDVAIDGAAARPVCMVLNVRPRRIRPRSLCRLIGGMPQPPMEAAS